MSRPLWNCNSAKNFCIGERMGCWESGTSGESIKAPSPLLLTLPFASPPAGCSSVLFIILFNKLCFPELVDWWKTKKSFWNLRSIAGWSEKHVFQLAPEVGLGSSPMGLSPLWVDNARIKFNSWIPFPGNSCWCGEILHIFGDQKCQKWRDVWIVKETHRREPHGRKELGFSLLRKEKYEFFHCSYVLVSSGHCNMLPWYWWLQTIEIYSFTVLGARPLKFSIAGPKSKCWQSCATSVGSGGQSSTCFLQLLVACFVAPSPHLCFGGNIAFSSGVCLSLI